ncbi:MAG: hypothetical protein KDE56_17850, partial [Anaerolineales bacterium]|nr:hypothetical protein [Anaerolineales bacterium]
APAPPAAESPRHHRGENDDHTNLLLSYLSGKKFNFTEEVELLKHVHAVNLVGRIGNPPYKVCLLTMQRTV